MNIADKVVRIDAKSYEFVVDFANKYDLKISEAVSLLMKYCASKNLSIKRSMVEVIEMKPVIEESGGL